MCTVQGPHLEDTAVKFVSAALTVTALSLALSACDKPKDRTPPPAEGTAAAPATPAAVSAPLPPTPAWAAAYMGKTVAELFPQAGQCVGNTDNVSNTLTGGVEIVGWGWDTALKQPVARVVLTDQEGRVIGFGETGVGRPDVPAAKPEITSQTTGWKGYTSRTDGWLDAYGVTNDGKGQCKLGHLDL
jgi:hypothetical protein